MTVLVLRTVNPDGTSYNGFRWPEKGPVTCPDFLPEKTCQNGLFGYLRGVGDAASIRWDGLFQVVRVPLSEIIDLGGKVKFPRGEVVFTGSRQEATDLLVKEYPGLPIIGAFVVSGDWGTSSSGDRGTSSSGYRGTSSSGKDGTISIKYWDEKASRYRTNIGYIGEDGLEPGVPYVLDSEYRFVRKQEGQ